MNKLVWIFISLTATVNVGAFDASIGKAKSLSCAGCHGVDGNSIAPTFPKLAAQNQGYLLKQMQDFKSGRRVDAVMQGIVAPLSEVDMQNLAAYYSQQTLLANAADKDKNHDLGQKIYRGGKLETKVTACIACHGPNGRGIPSAGFPVLASQHVNYTIKQLKDFRQDSINLQTGSSKPSRTNDFEGVMINFTKSLTNAEIEAVADYIATLY